MQRNYLRFGEYEFVLAFRHPRDSDEFRARRDKALMLSQGTYPSRHLDLVPNPTHFTLGNTRIHRRLVEGPVTSLFCGVRLHTGEPVAVRQLNFTKETQRRVLNELKMMSRFSGNQNGILGLIDQWCEHGMSPPCQLHKKWETSRDDEQMFYSMPLAEYDFESFPWSSLDFDNRLEYFHQTLAALREIHQSGIIHGAIRPRSLMIMLDTRSTLAPSQLDSSRHHLPNRVAISNFAYAVARSHLSRKPKRAVWVAPEVWASTTETPYDKKADVWSLAVSWLRAFVYPPEHAEIDQPGYRRLLKTVDDIYQKGKITEPFRSLLLRMLAWDPEHRPDIGEALASDVWESVVRRQASEREAVRRERDDRIKGPGDGVKRVRVLSPEGED